MAKKNTSDDLSFGEFATRVFFVGMFMVGFLFSSAWVFGVAEDWIDHACRVSSSEESLRVVVSNRFNVSIVD